MSKTSDRKGRAGRIVSDLWLIAVLAFLYLPIVMVVAFSFNQSKNGVLWTGFTTDWYRTLFESRAIADALSSSLVVALFSCALSAVLGTLGAVGLARARFKGKGVLQNIAVLPIMLPEVAIGLAFMTFFSLLRIPFGRLTLIIAHTTFCIPYVLLNVQARLKGLDPALEEAARDLGASPRKAFFTVTLPLILPAVFSGVLLAFAMSLDDMVISFFVTGPETTTLPVYIFGKLKTNVPPSINALCSLMLGATLAIVALSRLVRRSAEKDR